MTSLNPMRGMGRDMLDLLRECLTISGFTKDCYFVAADLTWSRPGPTGNALTRLAERGLLQRSSDPSTWGRSRYSLTDAGLAFLASCDTRPQGEDAQQASFTSGAVAVEDGQTPIPAPKDTGK